MPGRLAREEEVAEQAEGLEATGPAVRGQERVALQGREIAERRLDRTKGQKLRQPPRHKGGRNGLPPQECGRNGLPPQECGRNGLPQQECGRSGLPPQECGHSGLPPQECGHSGLPPQECGHSGLLPQREQRHSGPHSLAENTTNAA